MTQKAAEFNFCGRQVHRASQAIGAKVTLG
jgi:hypothetical protein